MTPLASSVLLSLLALAPHLGATTLLIDFGNNGSNGVQTSNPDTHGSYWNNSFNGGYTVTDMVTQTNVATTIDLSYITPVTTNSAALSVTSAPNPFNTASAYQDAIFTTGTTVGTGITLRLSQLDASKTYIFTLFGSRNATDSRTTNFSISGGSTVTGSLQTSGTNLGGTGINHNISNTLVLGGSSGIAPNGSNQIDVTLFANLADTSDFGYLNAMQVTVIPEPTTAFLGGLGMLALLRRRRSH